MNDEHLRLDRALDEAIHELRADSGTIHMKEHGRRVLHLAASHDIPDFVLRAVKVVPWGKGMAGVAAETAAPVTYCNIESDGAQEIHPKARAAGVKGALVVPIMSGSELVGTIGIGCSRERTFTLEETEWLMEFGRRLAQDLGEDRMAA
jgi:GAF domain-containing protein